MCGAIKFGIKALIEDKFYFCHCADCRKNSGMYGAYVPFERGSLKTEGEEFLKTFKSGPDTERSFCGTCGSPLFWDRPSWKKAKRGVQYAFCGAIDGLLPVKNGLHIFTEERGVYYEICGSLPQYKTLPR